MRLTGAEPGSGPTSLDRIRLEQAGSGKPTAHAREALGFEGGAVPAPAVRGEQAGAHPYLMRSTVSATGKPPCFPSIRY